MANYISLSLYVLTVFAGLYIDKHTCLNSSKSKKLFLCWLFVFYCFGYMIGDDWRNYEVIYNDPTSYKMLRFLTEPSSLFSFYLFPKILPDFWLYLGLMKCLYLYSVIELSKKITPFWLSCVSIMTIGQLKFLLVDCPLRFMLALIFINIALSIFISNEKRNFKYYLKLIVLLLVAVSFHNTCFFYFLIIPFLHHTSRIYRIKRSLLFLFYCLLLLLTSNSTLINSLVNTFSGIMLNLSMNASDGYQMTDNSSLFTVGNLSQIFFFIIILFSRDKVGARNETIKSIYCLTIFYFFMCRLFLVVPTGFRMPMALSVFYVVYLVHLLKNKLFSGKLIITYMLFAFISNTWNSFNMLPYSNSIPYIVFGHKPYDERYYYNFECYKERMGHNHPKYYEYLNEN